jgi:hypothetical protein
MQNSENDLHGMITDLYDLKHVLRDIPSYKLEQKRKVLKSTRTRC